MAPTLPEECVTNNGVYGSVAGDQAPVSFGYSVELDQDLDQQEFENMILPALEVAFNDALVPTLFEVEGCERRRRRLDDDSGIEGLSTRPPDTVDESIECEGEFCYGVLGSLTVFHNGGDPMAIEEMVQMELRTAMESGRFDDDPPIVSVKYANGGGSSDDNFPPGTGNGDGETESGGNDTGILVGSILGASAGVVLLGAAGYTYRKRSQEEAEMGGMVSEAEDGPTGEGGDGADNAAPQADAGDTMGEPA